MKKLMLLVMVTFGAIFVSADTINQNGQKDGYDVKLYTTTTPVSGSNDFFVTLSKDGKVLTDAKVKIKVFMPAMPGMPYMVYKTRAELVDGVYKMMINFGMNGTWQYHLKFKTSDNEIHTLRGSLNV
jgi:hypothetical protein